MKKPENRTPRTKSDLLKENADVIEKYRLYRAGEITRNQLFDFIWKKLARQITALMNKNQRKLNAETCDLYQQAALAILDKLDDYDPLLSLPGTYFLNYVNEYQRALVKGDQSIYYMTQISKLNRVAKDAGFEGISDDKLTDVQLASLSGYSIQVVKNVRHMDAIYTPVNYDSLEECVEDPFHASPDKIVVEKERENAGFAAFRQELDDFEQRLFYAVKVECITFKALSAMLKEHEMFREYGLDHAPTPQDLSCMVNVCERKLAGNRQIAAAKAKREETINEQASLEELEGIFTDADFVEDL